jgi:SET domain-containing protein
MVTVVSWTNLDLVEVKKLADGQGLFSRISIRAGDMIGIFDGQVEVFTIQRDGSVDWRNHDSSMSIHLALENDRLYALMPLAGRSVDGIDFINHSCTPNCIVSTQGLVVRANRSIECGEHLTIEYRLMDLIKLGRLCWCNHVPEAQRCVL